MDKRDKHIHHFEKHWRSYERHKEFSHFHEIIDQHHKNHREFYRMHRTVKYFRPFALLFNLLILFLLFKLLGIKAIVVCIAILLIAKEIVQVFFSLHLEKRVFEPIEGLKNGVEQIARGNYDVRVECDVKNEIGLLVASFNEMAKKLRESEKVKSEYEENRKALIANISHDLKTPITSIQGYIEAILEDNVIPPENKSKYLQIIYRNIIYINKLIDDLFLFSKLDMQKLDFQFEKVPVKAFMSDMMEEFKFELDEKQVQFNYIDKMERDMHFCVDRKRIHQAVRNIMGNALKFGPEDGLVIRAELYKHDDFACLGISDNGPGIDKDKLPHIFDRFYRIDNERTKDLMSTGLGLAIARELVEAHGGRIEVSSLEGGGVCFKIALPLGDESARC